MIAIDIAKNVFHLIGITKNGKAVLSKRLQRAEVLPFVAQLPCRTIAMEACGGAHYWARQFQGMDYPVKLISAKYVKPFVKTNKNDSNDAQAIAEAASRAHMPHVSIKTVVQQDIQSIPRIREQIVAQRTAISNQVRGLLAERGIVFAKTFCALRRELPRILESDHEELTSLFKNLLQDLYQSFLDCDS